MKKYILIVLCLITFSGWAQLTGTYLKVPALTTPVGRALPDSTLIFVKQQVAFYMTTHALTATQTVQYAIDSSWYAKVGHLVFGTVTATVANIETLSVTGQSTTKSITTTGDNSITGNLAVSGTAGTGTLTVTGDASATGNVTAETVNTGQGDYELYAMDQDVSTTSSPSFSNLTAGTVTSTITITPKIKYVGTDTTGVGSTANIGTTMLFDGHLYIVVDGTPPTWKQLDN